MHVNTIPSFLTIKPFRNLSEEEIKNDGGERESLGGVAFRNENLPIQFLVL